MSQHAEGVERLVAVSRGQRRLKGHDVQRVNRHLTKDSFRCGLLHLRVARFLTDQLFLTISLRVRVSHRWLLQCLTRHSYLFHLDLMH